MADSGEQPSSSFSGELSPGAIYICAAPEDLATAQLLKEILEGAGFKAWYDPAPAAADEEVARERLEKCSVFSPLFTHLSTVDNWFKRQCEMALEIMDSPDEGQMKLLICALCGDDVETDESGIVQILVDRQLTILEWDQKHLEPGDIDTFRQLYDRWHNQKIDQEAKSYGAKYGDAGNFVFAGKSIDPQAGELVDILKENEQEKTAAISLLSPEELRRLSASASAAESIPDVEFGAPVEEEPVEDSTPEEKVEETLSEEESEMAEAEPAPESEAEAEVVNEPISDSVKAPEAELEAGTASDLESEPEKPAEEASGTPSEAKPKTDTSPITVTPAVSLASPMKPPPGKEPPAEPPANWRGGNSENYTAPPRVQQPIRRSSSRSKAQPWTQPEKENSAPKLKMEEVGRSKKAESKGASSSPRFGLILGISGAVLLIALAIYFLTRGG